MGAKKEGAGGEKTDDAKVISVYNINMYCEGCAKTVKEVVKRIDGVEDVKIDCAGNKVTVTGKVDPAKVKERLEEKTKRKVEIVSPQPTKDGGRAAKKADKKATAATRAAAAERGWAQAKKELQQERDNVTSLRSKYEQTKKNAKRQVEEKEKELANALNAVQAAEMRAAAAETRAADAETRAAAAEMRAADAETRAAAAETRAADAETRAAAAETRAAVAEVKLTDMEKKIATSDPKACPICLTNGKNLAFNCGHMTCQDCGSRVSNCPMCRRPITNRLRLFYSMTT